MTEFEDTDGPPRFESDVPVLPQPMTAEEFVVYEKRRLLEDVPTFTVPDIAKNGREVWRRQGVTLKPQNNYPRKVFLFERIGCMKWEPAFEGAQPTVPITDERLASARSATKWWWGAISTIHPSKMTGANSCNLHENNERFLKATSPRLHGEPILQPQGSNCGATRRTETLTRPSSC